MKEGDNIPEEILREWIEKAKPLVDSAWNLALDEAIRVVKDEQSIEVPASTVYAILNNLITRLSKLKKNIQ